MRGYNPNPNANPKLNKQSQIYQPYQANPGYTDYRQANMQNMMGKCFINKIGTIAIAADWTGIPFLTYQEQEVEQAITNKEENNINNHLIKDQ